MTVAVDTRHPVESYLRNLISGCDDPPLIDELGPDDLGSPCAISSIARAALSVLRSKGADVIRADLVRELAADDALVWARVRDAGHDVSTATDWAAVSRQLSWNQLQRRRQLQEVG